MSLTPEQASHWIEEIWYSLERHIDNSKATPQDRLIFLFDQYRTLFLLNRAILGQVVFTGAPPLGEQ